MIRRREAAVLQELSPPLGSGGHDAFDRAHEQEGGEVEIAEADLVAVVLERPADELLDPGEQRTQARRRSSEIMRAVER